MKSFSDSPKKTITKAQIQNLLPGKLTCPLKINGWKTYLPIEIVPFKGTFVSFRGGSKSQIHPFSLRQTFVLFGELFHALTQLLFQDFGMNLLQPDKLVDTKQEGGSSKVSSLWFTTTKW